MVEDGSAEAAKTRPRGSIDVASLFTSPSDVQIGRAWHSSPVSQTLARAPLRLGDLSQQPGADLISARELGTGFGACANPIAGTLLFGPSRGANFSSFSLQLSERFSVGR